MELLQGIDLEAIAKQKTDRDRVESTSMRLAAIQFAVQGRRENDGHLVDLAAEILDFLTDG